MPLIYVQELTRRLGFNGRRFLQRIQFRQNFGAMAIWIDASVSLRDLPSGIDEERISRRKLHHAKVRQRSIGSRHFVVRIGQQLEIKPFLGAKLLVGLDAIEAHSEDKRIPFGILRLINLKVVGLARASGSLVLGIEIKNDSLATIVLQAYGCTLLRWQCEIWSAGAFGGFHRPRQNPRNQKYRNYHHQYQQDDSHHRSLPRGTTPILNQCLQHPAKALTTKDTKLHEGTC